MSQLLPVLNARIGSDPIRGDLRGATRAEVEKAYKRQLEEDERTLKEADLSGIELAPEWAYDPFDLAFRDLAFSIEVPVAPKDGEKAPKVGFGQKAPTETKVILEPTSGAYRGGELVALMGPSGCGKSTLLDMIADVKTAPYTGTVYFNGRPRDKTFRLISSYVPQEDISFEHCTVREIVQFHMRLKADVPVDAPPDLLQSECDVILSAVGLTHVADTKFGGETVRGLSGGQRRRVTLAKGLIAWPTVLFADEPTSGLSATDAELVVRALRQVVHRYNVLAFVVIHQPRPEVASLFDRLLLLTARPGRCVYDGPMSELAEHCARVGFEVPLHQNAADFALDVITPDARGADPDAFASYYAEHQRPGVVKTVDDALALPPRSAPVDLVRERRERFPQYAFHPLKDDQKVLSSFGPQFLAILRRRTTLIGRNPELGLGIFIGQVLQGLIASLVVQGALQKRVKSEKDFDVYQNQLTVMMNITMRAAVWTSTPSRRNIFDYRAGTSSTFRWPTSPRSSQKKLFVSPSRPRACIRASRICWRRRCRPYRSRRYLYWPARSSSTSSRGRTRSTTAGTCFPRRAAASASIPTPVTPSTPSMQVYLNAFLLYLATDSLFQRCPVYKGNQCPSRRETRRFFAVTQKSSAEAQNVALFFFGFISMFNGVAPTPSAFPVWIRWGIWVAPGASMNCHRHPTHRSMNPQVSPTYYAMANLVIRGFIDGGNDNTESITNGVGASPRGCHNFNIRRAATAAATPSTPSSAQASGTTSATDPSHRPSPTSSSPRSLSS